MWLKAIRRENTYQVTKYSAVCAKHFKASDFKCSSTYRFANRNATRTRFLKAPRLKSDAIPSVFPSFPSYYNDNKASSSASNHRSNPIIRLQAYQERFNTEQLDSFTAHDLSLNCDFDFAKLYPSGKLTWSHLRMNNYVYIYSFHLDVLPLTVMHSVKLQFAEQLDNRCTYEIYCSDNKVPWKEYAHIVNCNHIERISQIENLLSFLNGLSDDDSSDFAKLNMEKFISSLYDSDSRSDHLVAEQLQLSQQKKNARRYHSTTFMLAYHIYAHNQSLYSVIRKQEYLILPSKQLLRKATSSIIDDGYWLSKVYYISLFRI
jgi:hypothetical protein